MVRPTVAEVAGARRDIGSRGEGLVMDEEKMHMKIRQVLLRESRATTLVQYVLMHCIHTYCFTFPSVDVALGTCRYGLYIRMDTHIPVYICLSTLHMLVVLELDSERRGGLLRSCIIGRSPLVPYNLPTSSSIDSRYGYRLKSDSHRLRGKTVRGSLDTSNSIWSMHERC